MEDVFADIEKLLNKFSFDTEKGGHLFLFRFGTKI